MTKIVKTILAVQAVGVNNFSNLVLTFCIYIVQFEIIRWQAYACHEIKLASLNH